MKIIEMMKRTIQVPHLDGRLKVAYPFFKDNVIKSAKQMHDQGLEWINMSETISFLYHNYVSHGICSGEVKKISKRPIFTSTMVLYSFKELGLFIQDNPKIGDNPEFSGGVLPFSTDDLIMEDEESLIKRFGSREECGIIYSDNGLTRFVPFYFKTGEQSPLELSKNPLVIVLSGRSYEEGLMQADKIAHISSLYEGKHPYVTTCYERSALERGREHNAMPEKKLVRVGGGSIDGGHSLWVDTYSGQENVKFINSWTGDDNYGYSFAKREK